MAQAQLYARQIAENARLRSTIRHMARETGGGLPTKGSNATATVSALTAQLGELSDALEVAENRASSAMLELRTINSRINTAHWVMAHSTNEPPPAQDRHP